MTFQFCIESIHTMLHRGGLLLLFTKSSFSVLVWALPRWARLQCHTDLDRPRWNVLACAHRINNETTCQQILKELEVIQHH